MANFKILIAMALLSLSGCVVMTRRNFNLLQYANRMVGQVEGADKCGEILKNLQYTEISR